MTFKIDGVIIDSREIIERIEELESTQADLVERLSNGEISESDMKAFDDEEGKELDMLREFAEECEQYSADWEYGETLIREDYFEQYMDEMIEDCYELPKNLPYWMTITYDYDALQQDYAEVKLDDEKYFIRSC